jgi:hypothetical protein
VIQAQLSNWAAQAPGVVLAALSYLLITRFAWELVAGGRGGNSIVLRVLRALTDPFVRLAAAITPRLVPAILVTGCTVVWIFAARIALVQIMAAMAMLRMLG